MSILWLLVGCAPFLILILGVLHQIDRFEKRFKPPTGKPGLPAWHKEQSNEQT